MENKNLYFTNIEQVIGIENINEIDSGESLIKFPTNWGLDRIVLLKENDTPIKRQWNGTCTSFATIAAMENKLKGEFELSERSLWDFYGKFSTQLAIETAKNNFVLEEKYWPQGQSRINDRIEKLGRFRISNFANLGTDYFSVLKAIDNGNPCIVGLSTPKDLVKGYKQIESTSKISRRGGHAMCVSGYKVESGQCYFLVKNSWGTKNGDNGYQYISFDLFKSKRKRYCLFWEVLEIEEILQNKKSFEIESEFENYWNFE